MGVTPAERARLEANVAAAELRRERLALELDMGTHPDPEALEAKLLAAVADVAELEERRAALEGAPAPAPAGTPATPPPPAPASASADEWLTTKEAAAELRLTVKGLERMRAEGRGPPFTRIGRAVRYRRSDLHGK